MGHGKSEYALMQGWNFEGSVDKINWTILTEHKDDESIQNDKKVATFNIDGVDEYYRYFRIYSAGRQPRILASLLEIYGYTTRDFAQNQEKQATNQALVPAGHY